MLYSETRIGRGRFFEGDCFDVMRDMPEGSVDMVLCDLPYGTTIHKNAQGTSTNSWDFPLPFDRLWSEYRRVLRPYGSVVLTAAQPFTSHLILSNLEWFKYTLVWEKTRAGGFFDVKYRPLRAHEDICVFTPAGVAMNSKVPAKFNPQGVINIAPKKRNEKRGVSSNVRTPVEGKGFQTQSNYPRSVLKISSEGKGWHPTQKPVDLFEYLILSYTDQGMTVLDNTAGSGTTAIAAENTGRQWICIERDPDYAEKARQRIREHVGESDTDDFDALL